VAELRGLSDLTLGDVNYDGLDDLIGRDPVTGQVWVAASDGSAFEPATVWGGWPANRTLKVVDVDGDGSVDLAGRDPGDGRIYVGYSDDTAFEPAAGFTQYAVGAGDQWELADVDSDFTADLIVRSGSAVRVGLFNDSTFGALADWGSLAAEREALFGDVDGDGAADMLGYDAQTGKVTLSASTEASFEAATSFGDFPTGHRLELIDGDASGQADIAGEQRLLGDLRVALTDMVLATGPPAGGWDPDPEVVYDSEDETLPASDPALELEDPPIQARAAGDVGAGDLVSLTPLRLGFQEERRINYRGQIPDPNSTDVNRPYISEQDAYGARANELDGLDTAADKGDGLLNQTIYRPLKAAGGSRASTKPIMRFLVQWGRIENRPDTMVNGVAQRYYFDKLDRAIDHARDQGFLVYLTLSGVTDFECNPKYNPTARACSTEEYVGRPTGLDPKPVEFGEFAAAVAGRYKGKVTAYGIWNEPNNADFLIAGDDRNDRHNAVHVLYRKLYIAAYDAIKKRKSYDEGLGYKDARLFVGELAQLTRSADICEGTTCTRKSLSALRFLKLVAEPVPGVSPGLIKTHGVAWHPYQHVQPPSKRGRAGVVGIGRADEIQKLLDKLSKRSNNGAGPRLLVTPKAKRPDLFFTEFGYFNGPNKNQGKPHCPTSCGDRYFKTEAGRAGLFRQALSRAYEENAKWMLIYHAAETSPQNFADDANEKVSPPVTPEAAYLAEYGLFSPTGEVTGTRSYGKGPNEFVTDNRQQRRAYCAIYNWARTRDYGVGASPCPR
jgi:hypothetical protein